MAGGVGGRSNLLALLIYRKLIHCYGLTLHLPLDFSRIEAIFNFIFALGKR